MNKEIEKLSKNSKKQRIVIIALIVCIAVVVFFSQKDFGSNSYKGSKYPLLDPLREFVSAESYVTNIQPLREYLQILGDKYPDTISIYYENINSGASIAVNKDLALFPASLSKLVQAILVVKKVENGTLTWDTVLKVEAGDISSDSGTLYQRIGDTSLTVDNLLEALLVESDNTAQNIFRRSLTVDDYINFQYQTGLQDLYNEKGFISAKEYTRILRVLYTSNFLEPQNSEKILKLMTKSNFKEYLSSGIPSTIPFAHKYGENVVHGIFADSGIVYIEGKPYMITVLIKGKDTTEETRNWAKELMKEISERAYTVSK